MPPKALPGTLLNCKIYLDSVSFQFIKPLPGQSCPWKYQGMSSAGTGVTLILTAKSPAYYRYCFNDSVLLLLPSFR